MKFDDKQNTTVNIYISYTFIFNIEYMIMGAGEVAQQLRALAALVENWCLVLRSLIKQFTKDL